MTYKLLNQMVSINSVFPHEEELTGFVENWIDKNVDCQIETQNISNNRRNILVTKTASENKYGSVFMAGHLDTVPVVNGWGTDPFAPVVKQGCLYGLGSWDMKAGLSIILQVLKEATPKNFDLKAVFTVDEENFSVGAWSIVEGNFLEDAFFGLVPEPGFDYGDRGITIGRTGRSTYSLKFLGKSSHGSYPEEGINAIDQASQFLVRLRNIRFNSDEDMGSTTIYPRKIVSEAKGFSVPDSVEMELDCKMVAPDTTDSVYQKISKLSEALFKEKILLNKPEIHLKDRPTPFSQPYKLDASNHLLSICQRVVRRVSGDSKLFFRKSVADECIYVEKLKIPVVCIGPSGGNAHQANEYVDLDSLENVSQIYTKILNDIDKGIEGSNS